MDERVCPGANAAAGAGLVDLMLVLTILGILSAAAVLSLRGDDLAIDRAAREVVADALQAQQLAIETGQALGLRFEVATNRAFFVLKDGRTPKQAEASLRAIATLSASDVERLLEARASGDPSLADATVAAADFGGTTDLIFNPDGSPLVAGAADLRRGAEWLRVRVQTAGGRIVITQP